MEEIYLSPDGLYEYSIAELQEAAKESKINFEEFISSRGFKLKGSEVEETIEVEDKNSGSALRALRKLSIDYEIIE